MTQLKMNLPISKNQNSTFILNDESPDLQKKLIKKMNHQLKNAFLKGKNLELSKGLIEKDPGIKTLLYNLKN